MNRLKWFAIALVILALFAFLIPVHIAAMLGAFYYILPAILVLFFFFLGFKNARSIGSGFKNESGPKIARWMTAILIVMTVGTGVLTYGMTDMRTRAALKENGVFAEGKMTDGEQTSRRGTESSNVEFTFTTKKGEKISGSESVTSSQFNGAFVGKPVDVIYLPDHPEVHRLIMDFETRMEYSNAGQNLKDKLDGLREQLENNK